MSGPAIAVEVEDEAWTDALPDCEALVERAAALAADGAGPLRAPSAPTSPAAQGRKEDHLAPPSTGELSPQATEGAPSFGPEITVLLAGDETVRDLNARFRGKDSPTNVLSFPAPDFARPHLGDVALAYGVCAREAEAQGKTLADHLSHLTVHGVLHLLGYDHEAEEEAEEMEAMERRILEQLGVRDPYAHEADA